VQGRWRAGAEAEVVLRGASMAPTIRPGDRLRVAPMAAGELPAVGEVVVTTRDGTLVAHRVAAVSSRAVITRGDALARPDSPIAPDQVLGRVIAIRPAPLARRLAGLPRRLLRAVRRGD
jgi:signal peptidase I